MIKTLMTSALTAILTKDASTKPIRTTDINGLERDAIVITATGKTCSLKVKMPTGKR